MPLLEPTMPEPKSAMVVEPVLETEKSVVVAVAVEEPIAKRVVAVEPLFACTANFANGEEVATPRVPVVGSTNCVEVAGRRPKSKPPILSALLMVDEVANVLLPMTMLLLPVVRFGVVDAPIRRLP